MPRQKRFLPPGNYYHIMNRGNNGQRIFTCDEDCRYYLEKLSNLKSEHPFELMHYCLMSTHTHMLVKTTKGTDFSLVSRSEIMRVQNELNDRPRKVLEWKKPNEIFNHLVALKG